jgi:hypothetical protein
METSDLLSALRVAERACLSAEKEAAWEDDLLPDSDEDKQAMRVLRQLLLNARCGIVEAVQMAEEL